MAAGIAGELFLIWRLKDGSGNRWRVVLDLAVEGWWRELQVSCCFSICRLKDGGGNHWLAGKSFLMCLLTDGGGNYW